MTFWGRKRLTLNWPDTLYENLLVKSSASTERILRHYHKMNILMRPNEGRWGVPQDHLEGLTNSVPESSARSLHHFWGSRSRESSDGRILTLEHFIWKVEIFMLNNQESRDVHENIGWFVFEWVMHSTLVKRGQCECHTYKKNSSKNVGIQGQIFSLNVSFLLDLWLTQGWLVSGNKIDIWIEKARASSKINEIEISLLTLLNYHGDRIDIGTDQSNDFIESWYTTAIWRPNRSII